MRPISIQMYTLRQRAATDFIGVLRELADIGYVAVETAGLGGLTPAQVRKACDDLGLRVCSAHGPVPTKDNISELVDKANALGYTHLVSGLGPDDFKTSDLIIAGARRFAAGAELAADHGLKLAYHNHWWEMDLVQGRYGFDLFFENAPGVLSELDVYWASNFGIVDVPAFVAAHRDRVALMHVKDGPLVRNQPHTAVGAGKMDMPAVIGAAGPETQWLIVELDECATDMMQAVRDSYRYLTGTGLAKGRK